MFCISSLLIKNPEQGFIDENMNCGTGHHMEGSVQHKDRIWNKRRYAKQIKLDLARKFADGVVIPTQNIVKLLYYSYKIRKKLEITHRLSRSTILYAYV